MTFLRPLAAFGGLLAVAAAPAQAGDPDAQRPRLYVSAYTDATTPELARQIARYGYATLGLAAWPGRESRHAAHLALIKSLNPGIKLGQYVNQADTRDPINANDAVNPWVAILNLNDWWLRDAMGARVRIGEGYAINFTDWTRPDANSERFPEVKARIDYETLLRFQIPAGLDYVFIDNASVAWLDGNFKRNGAIQNHADPEVDAAWARGTAAYAAALRARAPGLKLMANAFSLDAAGVEGSFEMGFRECLMGKPYSLENQGWDVMMDSYRAMFRQLKAGRKDVVFGACGPATGSPAYYRYGLASALLADGIFAYSDGNYQRFPWYDESDAPIGTPAEPPPTAAHASGLWMRRYSNALVLVNPGVDTARTVNVGPGYRYLKGAIDPGFNTGEPVSVLTLAPRSGAILIRQ